MSLLFSCTALAGTNKKGILRQDEYGYYEIAVGALNAFNSQGEYYAMDNEVQELFSESSHFMRRMRNGCLRGELGHPQRLPGMTKDEYMIRIMTILESNTSHHIRDVRIDFDCNKNADGSPMATVIASVKPSGIKAKGVQDALDNSQEDSCFSVRSFTEDAKINGVNHRFIRELFTWDYVTEPGISISRKYKTPSLEGFDLSGRQSLIMPVTADDMNKVIENVQANNFGIGTESANLLMTAESLFKLCNKQVKEKDLPYFLRWG
jgi:hypothetical protein